MLENEDVIYELNEKDEQTIVKSIDSTRRAYVRFTNCTTRPVDLWWRDFQGRRRRYVRLEPQKFFDINTFLTHPWEFTDRDTKEQFVINNKTIFRPPTSIADMRFRTNWNITIPVRTLRYSAMLIIALLLPDQRAASQLNLPQIIVSDIKLLLAKMGHET